MLLLRDPVSSYCAGAVPAIWSRSKGRCRGVGQKHSGQPHRVVVHPQPDTPAGLAALEQCHSLRFDKPHHIPVAHQALYMAIGAWSWVGHSTISGSEGQEDGGIDGLASATTWQVCQRSYGQGAPGVWEGSS